MKLSNLQKQIMNFDNLEDVLDNICEACNYEDGDGQFYNGVRIDEDTILVLEEFWGNCLETEYYHYSISKNTLVKVDEDTDWEYREQFSDCGMLDAHDCFFIFGMSPNKHSMPELTYGYDYNDTIVDLWNTRKEGK